MLRRTDVLSSVLLLVLACGDDGRDESIFGGTAPTTQTNNDTDDGDGDPSTGDGDPSTGDGDPSTGDGDPTNGEPCGNGIIDPGEECDGGNLNGSSCAAQGFDGGALGCDPVVCVFDTSGCTTDPGNTCDGNCNGCTCPSFECAMCCANKGQVDVCSGGMCAGCF